MEDAQQETALYRLLHPTKVRSLPHALLDLVRVEKQEQRRLRPAPTYDDTGLTAPEAAAHYTTLYPEYRDEMLEMQ